MMKLRIVRSSQITFNFGILIGISIDKILGMLAEKKMMDERFSEYIDMVKTSIGAIYDCRVPVVGVIYGAALGVGMALAAMLRYPRRF